MKKHVTLTALLVCLVVPWVVPPADSRESKDPIVVKLATLAPSGSPWHEWLKEMGVRWHQVSDGQVVLRIYPAGVAGSEFDTVRKIRIGQLHASLMTNNGLRGIAPEVLALVIPMLTDSPESLDKVFSDLTPGLNGLLESKGFVALNWGTAGWVRFFIRDHNPSIEAVRKARLWVWSGDDTSVGIWKSLGFNAIPLSSIDVLPSLQTGMIDAFNSTPLLALANQWFPFTPAMIDMPWAPLIGATIISKRTWEKIPEAIRPELKAVARDIGSRLRHDAHVMEQEAIREMQKRGLVVVKPDAGQLRRWQKIIKSAYPKLREKTVPAEWFDAALQSAGNTGGE